MYGIMALTAPKEKLGWRWSEERKIWVSDNSYVFHILHFRGYKEKPTLFDCKNLKEKLPKAHMVMQAPEEIVKLYEDEDEDCYNGIDCEVPEVQSTKPN